MNKLKIEYVPIDNIKLNPANPRKNDENVMRLIKSMEEFGWTNPILVQKSTGIIIAGHTRYKAAKEKGIKQVPIVYLDLDDTKALAYMLADNKLTELVEWDGLKLAEIFNELDQVNFDLELTGFNKDEIEDYVIGPTGFKPDESEQPRLDELSPIMVKCPKCGEEFNARENAKA